MLDLGTFVKQVSLVDCLNWALNNVDGAKTVIFSAWHVCCY